MYYCYLRDFSSCGNDTVDAKWMNLHNLVINLKKLNNNSRQWGLTVETSVTFHFGDT